MHYAKLNATSKDKINVDTQLRTLNFRLVFQSTPAKSNRLVKCGVAAGLSLGLDNPESRTAERFDNMP